MDTMNETHFEEVEIVNTLFIQLNDKADFESISESFDKLLSHMQEHFSTEEKLMREIQYPSLQMHKADHDKVLNQTRYAEMQWRNKKDEEALKEFLEDDVVAWLDQHIKAMDTPMSDFVLQSTNFSN
jgi:hemerythrin